MLSTWTDLNIKKGCPERLEVREKVLKLFYLTQSEHGIKGKIRKQVRINTGKKEQEEKRFGVYAFISLWSLSGGNGWFFLRVRMRICT